MAFSNSELRLRLAAQQWTAHNIRLTPELTTMMGQPDFMETDTRLHALLRTLQLLFGANLNGLRVADLGFLEGGFALAMARRGMNVVGIEVRRNNLSKALLLKEHFEVSNLELHLDDVKNFTRENYGTFDVVLALGIFYHLDQPLEWLHQVAATTRGLLIVDSHYAPSDEAALSRVDAKISQLGPLEQLKHGGMTYDGRWFSDCSDSADRETQLWASYSNTKSFWLTKVSLFAGLMRAGFDLVFEQYDAWGDQYLYYSTNYVRGMFLAIKTGAFVTGDGKT